LKGGTALGLVALASSVQAEHNEAIMLAGRAKQLTPFLLELTLLSLVLALGVVAGAATAVAGLLSPQSRSAAGARPPLILVQNPTMPLTLPEMAEPPVSPINPGTLPGSTAAIGGTAIGSNPITGLPCNGSGSISVSGAGGLPGTATAPPGTAETLDQIPVGAPPTTSIYGSQLNLGSC
jgi:hypothetical protein